VELLERDGELAVVITPKTVDHHVSAVLAKLGVASRREAGTAAPRLAAAD
jgi:DNA-binding NarL/FixJ family response regulator